MRYKMVKGRLFTWRDMAEDLRLDLRFLLLMRSGLLVQLTDEEACWHIVCLAFSLPEHEGGVVDSERCDFLLGRMDALNAELRRHKTHSPSVARCLRDPRLRPIINKLKEELGPVRFDTFMSKSVAARLLRPEFIAAIERLLAVLGPKLFTTAMCGSLAARLLEPDFIAALDRLLAALGPQKFATFMCDSAAARLLQPAFIAALDRLLHALGAATFASAMCNSMACRLDQPAFVGVLDDLLAVMGPEKLASFVGINPTSCRLTRPDFQDFVQLNIERLGVRDFVKIMGNGKIACRFEAMGPFMDFYAGMPDRSRWTHWMTDELCKGVPENPDFLVSADRCRRIARLSTPVPGQRLVAQPAPGATERDVVVRCRAEQQEAATELAQALQRPRAVAQFPPGMAPRQTDKDRARQAEAAKRKAEGELGRDDASL